MIFRLPIIFALILFLFEGEFFHTQTKTLGVFKLFIQVILKPNIRVEKSISKKGSLNHFSNVAICSKLVNVRKSAARMSVRTL